jgi:ubiquinone/menaquinone biosynthesis C-methylase UbiE
MNFNDEANTWDTERRIKRSKQICDFVLRNVEIDKENTLLDFGCGTGLISQNFVNVVSRIVGYDQSEGMLEVFNSKFQNLLGNVRSTNTLDGLDDSIDIVISSMVFHHISDIDRALIDLRKVLRDDGKLIIIDLDRDDGSFHRDELGFNGHNGFDREMFINTLKLNGFDPIAIGTVLNDIKYLNGNEIPYSLFYVHAKKCR